MESRSGPPPELGRSGVTPTAAAAETDVCKRGDNAPDEEERKFLDLVSNKNMKLAERVIIPAKQHPKFNFVGKLLGPRGNSLKRMQEETGTKMSILGKGSMRDKAMEEEMRKSGENKYAHLSEELHVLIEVFAPPSEAYSRMGHALDEVKKYLVPDYNDEIRQEQLRELSFLKGEDDVEVGADSRSRGGHSRGPLASVPTHGRAALRVAAAPRGPPLARALPPPLPVGRGAPAPPRARPAPAYRAPPPPPLAQEAYEEDYDYENGYITEYEDSFETSFPSQTQSASDYYAGYEQEEYESYGENGWAGSNGHLKALPARAVKAAFREHPYGI